MPSLHALGSFWARKRPPALMCLLLQPRWQSLPQGDCCELLKAQLDSLRCSPQLPCFCKHWRLLAAQ